MAIGAEPGGSCTAPVCGPLTTPPLTGWMELDAGFWVWVQGGLTTTVTCTATVLRTTPNSTTLLATDRRLLVDATGGPRAITLPTAATFAVGVPYLIADWKGQSAANNITVTAAGAETINGTASVVLATNHRQLELFSDGVNWVARG